MEETTLTKDVPQQSAEKFIADVRRKTRRKFTAEEKIRVVLEGMKREITVSELCRREGVPSAVYYSWLKDFMEAGKGSMREDSLRDATTAEVQQLTGEHDRLKQLVADLSLQNLTLKKSLG